MPAGRARGVCGVRRVRRVRRTLCALNLEPAISETQPSQR